MAATLSAASSSLTGSPAGNGIGGMRERAAALGGTLEAGQNDTGGWRVRATLPLGAAAPNGTGEPESAAGPAAGVPDDLVSGIAVTHGTGGSNRRSAQT